MPFSTILEPSDVAIVVAYVGVITAIGLLHHKAASQGGVRSFFLGNGTLPWWALGASGMSSNLDISGTMINTALIYGLGARGFYVELRGGVTLSISIFMVLLGKYTRRGGSLTVAEWMTLRFGDGRHGKVAQLATAVTQLVLCVGSVTYFTVGAGKFVGGFVQIPGVASIPGDFFAGLLLVLCATAYTVASGLRGVVWTDVVQGGLVFIIISYVCGRCILRGSPYDRLPAVLHVPMLPAAAGAAGQQQAIIVSTPLEDWLSISPSWQLETGGGDSTAWGQQYGDLGWVSIAFASKALVEGLGGPTGYTAQRYLAVATDRQCGQLSLFWLSLLSLRWPFIMAVALLGLELPEGAVSDPETVLPAVVASLPAGGRGFVLAGLLAAGMSTFDSVSECWVSVLDQ